MAANVDIKTKMFSPTTQLKRNQLLTFIHRKLKTAPCVRGVVGIGSIAVGNMRSNSDLNVIIFMDPIDEAFMHSNEEPGRAWNMAEWKRGHRYC